MDELKVYILYICYFSFYFGNIDEFNNDFGSLLRCAPTKDHTLNPLGKTVEQVDGPF
jgi:hypothetical protein